MRELLFVLALVTGTSPAMAQEWSAYASPEEGFSVEAPGSPQFDHSGFDAKTMTGLRNHVWRASGATFVVAVTFRTGAAMAQTPPARLIRNEMAEAKGPCELRDEQPLDIPGGMGMEFVVDKCPNQRGVKARLFVVDDRLVSVIALGPAGIDQAADTQRFLDSFKLTAVIPAEWKTYTFRDDNFTIQLPGTPAVKDGGFHPNTYVSGRVVQAETRSADYAVSAAIRRRDGMAGVPNEQFLAFLLRDMKGECELRDQRLSIPGGIGAAFIKDKCPDGTAMRGQYYLADDRLYQLLAGWPAAGAEPPEVNQFFESFRLLLAAAPAAGPAVEPQQWQTFVSAEDGFAVDVPGKVVVSNNDLDASIMISNRQYIVDQGDIAWLVTATQFRRIPADPDAMLTNVMVGMKRQCASRDERRTRFPGGLALDFVLETCPDGMTKRVRVYALGDRLYQALVAGRPGVESKADAEKFFNSFKPTAMAAAAPGPAAAPAKSASAQSRTGSMLEGAMKRFPDAQAGGGRETTPQQRQATAPQAAPSTNVNWGALAIDVDDSDPSYGVGGGDSEAKASDNAMRFCRRAGGTACKVVVTYNQCAAYAASRRKSGSGKGATQKAAEAQAIEACNDRCRIVISDCN